MTNASYGEMQINYNNMVFFLIEVFCLLLTNSTPSTLFSSFAILNSEKLDMKQVNDLLKIITFIKDKRSMLHFFQLPFQ